MGLRVLHNHKLASTIRDLSSDWDKRITFSFVRNPFDQIISFWSHCLQTQPTKVKNYYNNFGTFKDWVLNSDLKSSWVMGGLCNIDPFDQYKYLHDENGKKIVNHIFRFENFFEECKKLIKLLGINISVNIDKINSSQHDGYRQYYNKEMVQIIENKYKTTLNEFGYKF